MAVGREENDVGVQIHHAFMVCHARVWIGTPTVQLVLRGNAAVQLKVKGKVYAGSHQRALGKGSQLVLTTLQEAGYF
jgi:hypothetical protein